VTLSVDFVAVAGRQHGHREQAERDAGDEAAAVIGPEIGGAVESGAESWKNPGRPL
jgi:hypothetical protein